MLKFVLAAIAALSIVSTAAFAGPTDTSSPTAYSSDFQLQGR